MTITQRRSSFSPLSRANSPARTRSNAARVRARMVARIVVIGAVFLGLVSGAGTSYASAIDILPNLPDFVAKGLTDAETFANGVGLTDVAAVAGEAVAGGASAAAIDITAPLLATAGIMYVSWKAGDALGRALPCFDCPPASSGTTYPGGTWYCGGNTLCSTVANYDASKQGILTNTAQGWTYNVSGTRYDLTLSVTGTTFAAPTQCGLRVYDQGGGHSMFGSTNFFAHYAPGNLNGYNPPATSADFMDQNCNPIEYRLNQTDTGGVTVGGSDGVSHTGENVHTQGESKCQAADGTITSVTANSESFTSSSTVYPPMTYPACAPGSQRVGFSGKIVPDNPNSLSPPVTLVPPFTQPLSAPSGHPEWAPCMPGGASYPCPLTVTQTAADGSQRLYNPAIDYPINDPVADPDGHKIPAEWTCKWGPLTLPITECKAVWAKAPRVKKPVDNGSNNCSFSNFTLNPVSWVVTPLKCLFIPSDGAMTKWQATLTSIEATPLVTAGNGIINWIRVVIVDLNGDSNQPAVACPTDDNGGGPIHWCQIVKQAGDMTQLNAWGQGVFTFAKIILYVFFGLAWYNKITASIGSKSQT